MGFFDSRVIGSFNFKGLKINGYLEHTDLEGIFGKLSKLAEEVKTSDRNHFCLPLVPIFRRRIGKTTISSESFP